MSFGAVEGDAFFLDVGEEVVAIEDHLLYVGEVVVDEAQGGVDFFGGLDGLGDAVVEVGVSGLFFQFGVGISLTVTGSAFFFLGVVPLFLTAGRKRE